MAQITVKIARTDGKKFETRVAFVEKTELAFDGDTAVHNRPARDEKYRLSWMVHGDPGEYQVQITTPPEAVDKDANNRKRKIDIDGFGAGLRRFKVGE